jgi:hypothetical protein
VKGDAVADEPKGEVMVGIVFPGDPEPEGVAGVIRVKPDVREFTQAMEEVTAALRRLMQAQAYVVSEDAHKPLGGVGVRVVESLELRINGKTALEAHR